MPSLILLSFEGQKPETQEKKQWLEGRQSPASPLQVLCGISEGTFGSQLATCVTPEQAHLSETLYHLLCPFL